MTSAPFPISLDHTTLRDRKAGDRVNLEADILGKYVEKLLGLAPQERRAGANRSGPGLSREFLEQYGY